MRIKKELKMMRSRRYNKGTFTSKWQIFRYSDQKPAGPREVQVLYKSIDLIWFDLIWEEQRMTGVRKRIDTWVVFWWVWCLLWAWNCENHAINVCSTWGRWWNDDEWGTRNKEKEERHSEVWGWWEVGIFRMALLLLFFRKIYPFRTSTSHPFRSFVLVLFGAKKKIPITWHTWHHLIR